MLHNLSVAKKIWVIVIFLLFGFLLFGGLFIKSFIDESNSAKVSLQEASTIEALGAVIHELQKERGLSVGYLNGGFEISVLNDQRALSDKAIARLDAIAKNEKLSTISSIRNDVNSKID